MARMPTLMEKPALHPGVCSYCRTGPEAGNREYFIDTGLDSEYDGVIYICSCCLESLVETTKPSNVVTYASVQRTIEDQEGTVAAATKALAAIELVKSHLHKIGLSFEDLFDAAVSLLDETDAGVEAADIDAAQVIDTTDISIETTVPVILEPVKIEYDLFQFENDKPKEFTFVKEPGADGSIELDDGAFGLELSDAEPIADGAELPAVEDDGVTPLNSDTYDSERESDPDRLPGF